MAVYNSHNTKQWEELLNAINGGDTSAIATALTNIKSSVDNIYNRLNSVGFDTTQWANLINAITNQSLNVDLSNITSDVVSNESAVTPADTVTEALDVLKSDLTMQSIKTSGAITATTDALGRLLVPYKVKDIINIFSQSNIIVSTYRIDASNPSQTLVFIKDSTNTSPLANTSVTVYVHYYG